jgi:DNA-directed RNA polymerase subunit omega
MLVEEDNDKKTVIALREIAENKVDAEELKKSAILRLRKEPDETFEEEETEEVLYDDFEEQYKGEVSKSGTAILPSKRMRKVPVQTVFSGEKKFEEKKDPQEDSHPLELTEEIQVEKEKK